MIILCNILTVISLNWERILVHDDWKDTLYYYKHCLIIEKTHNLQDIYYMLGYIA